MGAFGTIIGIMQQMDLFQLFFPWLLVLAVTYGLLTKYDFFGDQSVSGVIALAFSFITVGGIKMFVPVGMFTHLAAIFAFGMMALLGFIVILALAGFNILEMDFDDRKTSPPAIGAIVITIVGFIGVVVTKIDIGTALGGVQNTFQEVIMPILVLVFLILIVGSISE